MAFAQPSKSNVNIMLWNVSSTTEEGMSEKILDSMRKVVSIVQKQKYKNLMILCTDQINQKKDEILRQIAIDDRSASNTEAKVYHAEGNVSYLDLTKEPEKLPHKRLTVTITTNEQGKKTLVASWHGPRKSTREKCLAVLKGLEELKNKHECSAVIVGGDFNLPPDELRQIVERDLPPNLHVEVADDYTCPKDRSIKLDYLVYWPKWAFAIKKTELVAEDLRRPKKKRVFDHPIVMYSLLDWSPYDFDGDLGAPRVAVRKWELMKAGADFTFSCSSKSRGTTKELPAMRDKDAKQILDKLELGQMYRMKGSAVFAGKGRQIKTVKYPVQCFLSRTDSPPWSVAQFDNEVRGGMQKNCIRVYGIYSMTGYVHKGGGKQGKVGRKKKTSTRTTKAKLAGTKTALIICTSTPGSSTPATVTATATATPPDQVTPTQKATESSFECPLASENESKGMNTAQQQPQNTLPANSVTTPKRKNNDPLEELSESTASSKRLKATKQGNDTIKNDFGAMKTALANPQSVTSQSTVGQQMPSLSAATFSQQSNMPPKKPLSQAVPFVVHTTQAQERMAANPTSRHIEQQQPSTSTANSNTRDCSSTLNSPFCMQKAVKEESADSNLSPGTSSKAATTDSRTFDSSRKSSTTNSGVSGTGSGSKIFAETVNQPLQTLQFEMQAEETAQQKTVPERSSLAINPLVKQFSRNKRVNPNYNTATPLTSVTSQSTVGQHMSSAATFSQQSSTLQGNPLSQAVLFVGQTTQGQERMAANPTSRHTLQDRRLNPNCNTVFRKAVVVLQEGKQLMLCESDDMVIILQHEPGGSEWTHEGCVFKEDSPSDSCAFLLRENEPLEPTLYEKPLQFAKDILANYKRSTMESQTPIIID